MSAGATAAGSGAEGRLSWNRIATYAGAIIAFLIGSGFATGQEILQYFTSYGWWGILGTGLAVLVLMTYVCLEFPHAGGIQRFSQPGAVFRYYGGRWIGTFFDYFSLLFIFLGYMVMISGMGALVEQHYGWPRWVGGVVLATLAATTVFFGLSSLIEVIGKIGPVIVVLAILLGGWAVLSDPGAVNEGATALPGLEVVQASEHWFAAALSYVGFCMLWLATFLSAMGASARSAREARLGGLFGAGAFSLACMVVAAGLLANIHRVHEAEIPMLFLASDVSDLLADGFSLVIVAGIYTTAVPLLWTVASRVCEDRTPRFRVVTVVLAAVGCAAGLMVPFSQMINVVYVINGYVGILLLVLMIVRTVRRAQGHEPTPEEAPARTA